MVSLRPRRSCVIAKSKIIETPDPKVVVAVEKDVTMEEEKEDEDLDSSMDEPETSTAMDVDVDEGDEGAADDSISPSSDENNLSYDAHMDLILSKHYENNEDELPIKRMLKKLNKKYLLVPKLWELRYKVEKNKNLRQSVIKKAFFEFYSEYFFNSLNPWDIAKLKREQIFNRSLNWIYAEDLGKRCVNLMGTERVEALIKDALSFPHCNLEIVLHCFKDVAAAPISKNILELYQKSLNLYNKIMAATDNSKEWFNCLLETKDDRCIIQNVERQIAENPYDGELWKIYIKFLQKKNKDAAFEVYFRYRKFFLEDTSLEKDFKNFKLSISSTRYLQTMKFYSSIKDYNFRPSRKYIPQISMEDFVVSQKHQNFSFPEKLIQSITKKANSEILQKFYLLSKHFFISKPQLFCYSMVFKTSLILKPKYFKQALVINPENLEFHGWQNICITNSLAIFPCKDTTFFSTKIIPKLGPCNVRFLKIEDQNISVNDYNYLTSSKNVEVIVFQNVEIIDENEKFISLEGLMEHLPNASHIELPVPTYINKGTNLTTFSRNQKINHLQLFFMEDLPHPYNFAAFLVENTLTDSFIDLTFGETVEEKIKNYFKSYLIQTLDEWNFQHETVKPMIDFKEISS